MRIIMLGGPGAGKGTQAKMIAAKYGLPHVSTGDIFRANIKEGTQLGVEAKRYMDAGELVPDELTLQILLDRISDEDCKGGYILDGFPRTIPQATALDEALNKIGSKIDVAINIAVPDEVIVGRMGGRRSCQMCGATYHLAFSPPAKDGICDTCGNILVQREDDKPETVRNRLHVYHIQSSPLIDYYNVQDVLSNVDGTLALDEVFDYIVTKVLA